MDSTVSVNERMMVELSPNKMTAFVTFEPPIEEGRLLSGQDILKEIERNGIRKGVDKRVLATILQARKHGKRYTLATGLEPTVGEDAKIVTTFDISKETYKPVVKADGSVDYKNLDNITLAKAGEVIAKLIPASLGDDGYNVPGETLPGIEGKPTSLPKGKGVKVTEDGLYLISEVDGRIIYADGKISVSDLYEIQGDVGPETGNITFNGSVLVRGNVLTDYSIRATGNVEVHGVVEGAEIYSGGNILVTRGITGMGKAFLQSSGNITAKNIQNANLDAQGDIFAETIMHSNTKARGVIELGGKKGLLVGGTAHSFSGIVAKTVGSYLGTFTEISIGGEENYAKEYNEKMTELNKLKLSYRENMQYLNISLKKPQTTEELSQGKPRTSVMNTIDTTKRLKDQIKELGEQVAALQKLVITDLSQATFTVEDVVYPGVSIRIGNAQIKIDREDYKLKYRNVDGEIKSSLLVT